VPIIFLSIFASVFQGFGRNGDNQIRIALLDLDRSDASKALEASVKESSARVNLQVIEGAGVAEADRQVASGAFPAAVIIPAGFGAALADPKAKIPPLLVRFDPANPIAPDFAKGVLASATWKGLAPQMLGREIRVLEMITGDLTPPQEKLAKTLQSYSVGSKAPTSPMVTRLAEATQVPIDGGAVTVGQGGPSLVTYYTAAIGVMFMLFSALSTTGWLLEDQERGVLDRMRASGIGPWSVLLNRFVFAVMVGSVQIAVMLAWAAMVFGVRFFSFRQVVALLILVPMVAGAAAGLGLLITGIARTRRQQTTIGTITVLILSAVGGSMIPIFLMPPSLQAIGDWAFNARAIKAMQQVLWYTSSDDTLAAMLGRISPALALIFGTTVVCLVGARVAISRWH
ncbi:MAG: ABC transporter permease, partial [Phycisphaerales bacterium]|nr:ABC transporter permease [Phycisphaerales bacterium]